MDKLKELTPLQFITCITEYILPGLICFDKITLCISNTEKLKVYGEETLELITPLFLFSDIKVCTDPAIRFSSFVF